jgi:hypothetical protein
MTPSVRSLTIKQHDGIRDFLSTSIGWRLLTLRRGLKLVARYDWNESPERENKPILANGACVAADGKLNAKSYSKNQASKTCVHGVDVHLKPDDFSRPTSSPPETRTSLSRQANKVVDFFVSSSFFIHPRAQTY